MKLFKFVIIILFFSTTTAFAATFVITPEVSTFAVGDTVPVRIALNPEGESINALELSVVYPKDLLIPVAISDANSLLGVWVERPQISDDGAIHLSGITPGGFSGLINPLTHEVGSGTVVTIYFKARAIGSGAISLSETHILKNDGEGQEVVATITPGEFMIDTDTHYSDKSLKDVTPPLQFEIAKSSDQSVMDGKQFITFSTSDTESGIAYYEVKEGIRGWVRAESPYLLLGNGTEQISVRAVDRVGNERIARLFSSSSNNTVPTQNILLVVILCGGALALLFYVRKLNKKL
jgi:hypothetical protein